MSFTPNLQRSKYAYSATMEDLDYAASAHSKLQRFAAFVARVKNVTRLKQVARVVHIHAVPFLPQHRSGHKEDFLKRRCNLCAFS